MHKENPLVSLKGLVKSGSSDLLVFTDASFMEINGACSAGVILTDRRGRLIKQKSASLDKASSPLEA